MKGENKDFHPIWADEIDHAMKRGNSPYTALTVIGWLRSGQGHFAACGDMTASVWFRPDGVAEIGHISGTWNDSDATWLYRCLMRELRDRGLTDWVFKGRKGWERFLRRKGWL